MSPLAEACASADARSAEQYSAAQPVRSGSARDDSSQEEQALAYSAVPRADGSLQAGCLAVLPVDGSPQADSVVPPEADC